MKLVAILGLCAGLAVATVLVFFYGLDAVGAALLEVGWSGLLAVCAIHVAFVAMVGLAWRSLVPGARPWSLIWARLIREAGADVLALSQIGGLAMGARAATLRGVPGPVAVASTTGETTTRLVPIKLIVPRTSSKSAVPFPVLSGS